MKKRLLADGGLFGPSVVTEANGKLFQFLERSSPTEYDRIMDAVYRETHIGGGMHRSFDGSHSPVGSWNKIEEATGSVDLWEYVKAHANELVTPEGVPIMTLDKTSYEWFSEEVSDLLGDVVTPGQVGEFVRDTNSLSAGELLSSAIGSIFLFAAIRSNDHRAISRVVGANLCVAIGTGNPLQTAIALAGLAYGASRGKIEAWDLLKGSAPAIAGLLGYSLARHTLDVAKCESVLLGLVAGLAASALMAHLEARTQAQVIEELGDDPRYLALMTRGLLRQELRLLEHRRPTLALGV
jgi:hypothetical protein